MKLPLNRIFAAISTFLVVAGVVLLAAPSARAASASLHLSPGSNNVPQGSVLTVGIYVNTDEPVNAVKADLTYPAHLLDFIDINSSAAFRIAAATSGGGGAVQIDRGALPAVSGKQLVATVRFKAKVNTGTATINFADSSSVISANSNSRILSGTTGGKYVLRSSDVPASNRPPVKEDRNGVSQGRLEDAKLRACQSREQVIKNIMSRIADRGQKQLDLFTTISERTVGLYAKKGKTLRNYNALVADVDSKKTAAEIALNVVTTNSALFTCDGDNPKAVIISFKASLKTEIDALKAYRTSVKNLVVGVKSVNGGN